MTLGKIIDSIIQYYDKAMKDDRIKKPFSWALYQTWKWVDKSEMPKGQEKKQIEEVKTVYVC